MVVILHALVFLFFLLQYKYNVALATSAADCHERCEQSSGSLSSPGNKYHAMQGHSFKNFTLKKPFDCHLKCFDESCKCQAYQMQADRCELLDEDRFSAPDDFLPASSGYTYFDMHREFVNQVSWTAHCGSGPCKNKCCTQSPCYNEGTCTEICDHPKHKFNCTCSPKYIGRLCNKERSKSCKEQIQRNRRSLSGVYQLFDAETNSLFDEYCDFTSEDGFFWSLIESFSLANKDEIRRKPFFKDYPVNQDNFDWNRFRLSKSRMNITAIQSSHLRVTCNFNIDGLNYTDYLRARLSEIDIINLKSIGCKEHEYINIRGYSCYNCTTHFHQGWNFHAHIDSYNTPREECNAYFPDSVAEGGGEDNFGLYDAVNPLHRCSSNGNSTTQWWVGARY